MMKASRKSVPLEESQSSGESSEEEEVEPSPPPKVTGRTRCLKPAATGNITIPPVAMPPKTLPAKASPPKSSPTKTAPKVVVRGKRSQKVQVAEEIEVPSVRELKANQQT